MTPTLYILGGPNGAGKTTFYDSAKEEGFISSDLPFINVDTIARFELGGYSDASFAAASATARERMAAVHGQRTGFMVESVKASGYRIVLYFLSTEDVDENVARVQRRIAEGGHSVPEHLIKDRYRMAEVYLKSRFHLFDESLLIDNPGETAKSVAGWWTSALSTQKKRSRNGHSAC